MKTAIERFQPRWIWPPYDCRFEARAKDCVAANPRPVRLLAAGGCDRMLAVVIGRDSKGARP